MKKEEILARSRKERNTEYEDMVSYGALNKSVWVVAGICIAFAFVKIILSDIRGLERVIPFWEFPAILFANSSVVNLYIYAQLKSKSELIFGILSVICFIIFTYLYVMSL